MDRPSNFRFSLANIFLMTFIVALVTLGVTTAARDFSSWLDGAAIVAWMLSLGIPMTIGALFGGLKGLRHGFVVGACMLFVVSAVGMVVMSVCATG